MECYSQCSLIFQAVEACPTNSPSCYCPTYLKDGAPCSICLATISPKLANDFGSLSTDCAMLDSLAPAPFTTMGSCLSHSKLLLTSSTKHGFHDIPSYYICLHSFYRSGNNYHNDNFILGALEGSCRWSRRRYSRRIFDFSHDSSFCCFR